LRIEISHDPKKCPSVELKSKGRGERNTASGKERKIGRGPLQTLSGQDRSKVAMSGVRIASRDGAREEDEGDPGGARSGLESEAERKVADIYYKPLVTGRSPCWVKNIENGNELQSSSAAAN